MDGTYQKSVHLTLVPQPASWHLPNSCLLRAIEWIVVVGLIYCGCPGPFAIALLAASPAGPPFARDVSRTVILAEFKGQSYLQSMQSIGNGIFEQMNIDDG